MKYTQRLDYGRLAEVLHERGLAEIDAIRELLRISQEGGLAFCEALVASNLVSDWDLSRVVCETFQLPFLPVDFVKPNPEALEEIDQDLFRRNQIIPVDVFGQVLTIAMPALVPAEILAQVAAMTDFVVLPVVGTVESNKRWIEEHMAAEPAPDLAGGWGSLFDEADAAVQADLGDEQEGSPLDAIQALDTNLLEPVIEDGEGPDSLDLDALSVVDEEAEFSLDNASMELGEIEALPADDLETEPLPAESLTDDLGIDPGSAGTDGASGPSALPPMPTFDEDAREAG